MIFFHLNNLFRSRLREEFAPWSCNRARLAGLAELVRVPDAVAARKAPPVLRETAAPLLKAVWRRSPAPSNNRAVHHLASSSSRHNRRKASNVDDIYIDADRCLSILFAGVASSSLWHSFSSRGWAYHDHLLLSRGTKSSPAGEGFERECATRRL